MKNISCCFSGHREIPVNELPQIKEKLVSRIRSLLLKGYREFYTGGALGFDTLAAQALLELKKEFPQLHLHVIMPCRNQTRGWSADSVRVYEDINSRADEVVCLSENYYSGCMHVRNRYMVDRCSVIIAYLNKTSGGSAYTVNYAQAQGLEIINIAK